MPTTQTIEVKVDTKSFESAMKSFAAAMSPLVEATNPVVEAMTKFAEWFEALPPETRAMLHDDFRMPPVGFSEDEGPGITLAELLGEIDAELSELPNTASDNG